MNDLKFSILIPTFNGANVIDKTLRSILSQSFTNYEIIIVDNNSKDKIENIVKLFPDNRIKLFPMLNGSIKIVLNLGVKKNARKN